MVTDALFVHVQRRHPCALLIRCILVQAAWEDPGISDNKASRFGAPCFLSNHSASGKTEQRPAGISTQFSERVTPSFVSSCSPFLARPTNTNWTDSIRMHGGSPAHRGTGLVRVVRQRASPLAVLHANHSTGLLWLPQIAAMVDCGEWCCCYVSERPSSLSAS